ncbi:ESPR-type extended signal peptide-containing protein [Stenotrophomonas bentonitica]|uniref:ESPR-type extended signal peptide-containing protein n=1 Tax=Stenotrophomonas bentonitica TaxID=1450134 RepID=UPI003BAD6D7B
MNKIYRRLWSTARQCWVVASELTSPRGKPASSVGAAVLIVTASLVPGAGVGTAGAVTYHACQNPEQIILNCVPFMAHVPSMAQNTLGPNTSSYMMLGAGSHMQGKYSSLFGNWSSSVGDNNAVFGFDARARQGGSAVFGARSVADGFGAVAVGTYARASGQYGIAMGFAATTADNSGGISRIAIGNDSYAGTPGWTGAIALGGRARAEYDGVALGYEAQAKGAGSVALGRGAVATESYVVSVGNAAAPRRVVYVADGNVSQHSMDAVNGRQLLGVKETAERALDNSKLVTQTSASGQIRVGAENSGTVLDVRNRSNANRKISGVADAALSTSSTEAVTGKQLYATNQSVSTATSTANAAKASADAAVGRIGAAAVALGQAAVAEGSGSTASAALGSAAKAYNGNGVAMGADARAGVNDKGEKSTAATGAVAIGALSRSGNGAVASGLRASAIGDRAVALGNDANAAATHATAAGYKATASANQATAVGREASASGTFSTALGNLASARAESAVALGDRAIAAHTDSVALGNGSQTTAGNQISVGNDTLKRKIVNVADGALNTSSAEAVTGKQLNATNVEVASVRTTAASAQTTAGAAKTAADDALAKANALGGLVGQTSVTGNVRLGSENTGTVLDVRNKSNANRKLMGVADATLSTSSTEAVSGKQLNATNVEVASVRTTATSAQTTANTARTTADNALAKADVLGGLVGQVSATGNVRLGGENTGTVLDVRNKSNANRKLMGVADATLSTSSTEAVTGRQLFGVDQKVTANQSLLASHATELAGHEARIAGNRRDLDDLRTEFDNFDPDLEGVVRYAADGSVDMDGGKVRGVAAGDISSAGSTDAVNGGQLFATNYRLSAIESAGDYVKVSNDEYSEAAEAGRFGVAIGDGARASLGKEGGTAIGSFTSADARDSVALGRGANVGPSGDQGFALGVGTNVYATDGVALGAYARVEAGAVGSVALGAGSIADAPGTVSMGHGSLHRRLVNVGRGTTDTDATTVAQLDESLASLGGGAGIDVNGIVIAPTYRMQGAIQRSVEDALNILDGAVITAGSRVDQVENQLRSVFQDSPATRSDGLGQLNLAGANGMVLGNVANGLIAPGSRDAVNGGQLYAAEQKIERNRDDLEAIRSSLGPVDKPHASDANGPIDFGGARLTGIADANLSEDSRDVVAGRQLHASNSRIEAIEHQRRFFKIGTDSLSEDADAGWFGVAIGESAEASPAPGKEGGTAVGSFSKAMGNNSVALGRAAHVLVNATEGFALGPSSRVEIEGGVALGAHAQVKATATNGVALGYGSYADQANTVSVGSESVKRRIVNVGRGLGSGDASTVEQLHEALGTLGGGAGMDASGNVVAPTYRMQGATQNNVADALAVLDGAVITAGSRVDQVENQLRSVFQSSPSVHADGINHVVLAGAGGAILTNLADGRVEHGSRDAVTGSQLFEAKREIARNRSELNELQRDRNDLKSTDMAVAMAAAADVNFGGNRLTGISNGRISDGSSDAMTGAQLFQTNERVSDLELTNKVIAITSKNDSNSPAKAGDRSVAIGEYASASVDSEGGTAVGNYAQATAKNSVAIGQSSSVSRYNEGGLAIGSSARADARGSMAIGERAWVFGGAENSVAIGAGSEAMRSNEVSIGTYSNRRRLTSVANGIASYDAATAGQLRDALSSLGGGATLDRQGNLVSPSYKIQGGQQYTVNDALTVLDGAVITAGTRVDRVENQLRSVFQDSPATRSDGLGQLNLAGANGMVLGNVANGLIAPGSRDAINGGQLHAMEQRLDGRIDGLEQRVDATPEGRALASASAPTPPAAPEAEGPAGASGEPAAASAGRAGGGIASADGGGTPAPADAPAPTPQVNTADLEKMLARANEYTDGAISNFERRLDKMDKRFNRMAAMSSAQSAMAMNTAGLATYNRLGAGVGYSDGESALAVGYQRVLNERGSATFSLNGAFTNSGEQSVGLGVGIGW